MNALHLVALASAPEPASNAAACRTLRDSCGMIKLS